jgi:hypothetical protein
VRKASCAVALKEEMSPAIVNVTSTAATSKAPGGRGGGELVLVHGGDAFRLRVPWRLPVLGLVLQRQE